MTTLEFAAMLADMTRDWDRSEQEDGGQVMDHLRDTLDTMPSPEELLEAWSLAEELGWL